MRVAHIRRHIHPSGKVSFHVAHTSSALTLSISRQIPEKRTRRLGKESRTVGYLRAHSGLWHPESLFESFMCRWTRELTAYSGSTARKRFTADYYERQPHYHCDAYATDATMTNAPSSFVIRRDEGRSLEPARNTRACSGLSCIRTRSRSSPTCGCPVRLWRAHGPTEHIGPEHLETTASSFRLARGPTA